MLDGYSTLVFVSIINTTLILRNLEPEHTDVQKVRQNPKLSRLSKKSGNDSLILQKTLRICLCIRLIM